jgi:hypothetical protein
VAQQLSPKTTERQRAHARAWSQAFNELKNLHPEEFRALLEQAKARQGIAKLVPREPVSP